MTAIITPSPEQEQRAKWDLLLLDLELRTEQVRTMKAFENWRFVATVASAGAAVGGSIVAAIALLAHVFH